MRIFLGVTAQRLAFEEVPAHRRIGGQGPISNGSLSVSCT